MRHPPVAQAKQPLTPRSTVASQDDGGCAAFSPARGEPQAITQTAGPAKHEPPLEDVVRETLHPMLKSWLDENLSSLVERMVQAEIQRVARGE